MLVLTYHSISDAGGPTSIPRATFEMQMQALRDAGYRSRTLAEFIAWHEREEAASEGARDVLITFDDGFADFAENAVPALGALGLTALVFLPTRKLGHPESWDGANRPPRPLMDWGTVSALAGQGMEFGGHSRSHADLTRLDAAALEEEIAGCAADLSDRLGGPVPGFAAPYGRVNPAVLGVIRRHYRMAFGTRLAIAARKSDPADIPRIDMHYFRDRRRWAGFLEGRRSYFTARRGLRAVREMAGGWIG